VPFCAEWDVGEGKDKTMWEGTVSLKFVLFYRVLMPLSIVGQVRYVGMRLARHTREEEVPRYHRF
jgi:hypothetical protein